MHLAIRYLSYPLVAGGAAGLLFVAASNGAAYWPMFPLIVATSMAIVALLERLSPFQIDWNRDRNGDTVVDAAHFLVSFLLIQAAVASAFGLRQWLPPSWELWPHTAPMIVQILLAGLVMDLGLYTMHRVSHANDFLWRLHAIHHSPERVYWLNGGRRHPLSALVLAAPGLTVLLIAGATPIAVGAWLSFMSAHLVFQHANLDYRLGPLRNLFGVAEMHRWHHKRAFEDAQVNFGEVFLVWDRLFGTFHDASGGPQIGDVGLRDDSVPGPYWQQLWWPFLRR